MSWFNVWDGLKNKTCRYLLQRYLGQFLDERLNLEQLNVELYNGKATIKNVPLRVEALNELLEAQGWPLEFTGGHIGLLTVSVPWNALMTSDSSIEASDVMLCLRPVKREKSDGTSMIESMWSSVSSSLQLAEECMRQEEDSDASEQQSSGGIVGLEKFAETIDNVLNRIRARFCNICIKIEYPTGYNVQGVALNIKLEEVYYQNETGNEKSTTNQAKTDATATYDNINRLPTYAKHNVTLNGLNIYTQENWINEINQQQCNINHSDIPLLQITGQQNIQIKVKQSEDIMGPKICFDIELGAICAIVAPRQIQLLIMFLNGLSDNETNLEQRKRDHVSRNDNEIFGIPDEPLATGVKGNLNIWMSAEDNIITNKPTTTAATSYGNVAGGNDNYCDSMTTSFTSSTITSASKYQRKSANVDSCGEISNFVIKIANFMTVVLHEDILVESSSNKKQHFCNEHSLEELLNVTKLFFENIAKSTFDGELKPNNLYCTKNHIFVKMLPIVAEGKQTRNKSLLQLNSNITATNVEFCEILEGKISNLIKFNRGKDTADDYQVRPEFCMNITNTNSIQQRKNSTTCIEINLKENTIEFDVTIIDRLGALLVASPNSPNTNDDDLRSRKVQNDKKSSNNMELNINCSIVDINLRFPIVDLRPIHDPNRVPWWKQNIRSDYLLLRLKQFKLSLSAAQQIKLNSSDINVFYTENGLINHHLVNTCSKKNLVSTKDLQNPQIIIDFGANKTQNIISNSSGEGLFNLPFSSKRNCRQNSYAYTKKDAEFTENILLPAETAELNEFCSKTMLNSKIRIQIYLPWVEFFVESKHLYEIIYNRLNTDLFMWEPSSPYLTPSPQEDKQSQSILNMGLMDSVYISATSHSDPFEYSYTATTQDRDKRNKTSDLYKDDYDESDIELEEDNNEACCNNDESTIIPHNCSVELKVGEACGSFFVPVRDNDKHVLPEVCGKFILNLNNLNFFIVNGYNADLNLAFLCLQLKNCELYHCGLVPMNTPLKFDNCLEVEDFMQSTIYRVPQGLTKGINLDNAENEMLSLVIEIKKNPKQKIKRLKISCGIRNTTLRYHPSVPTLYWLNQLMDFMDVMDYPIEGYKPFSVISEMQLHLWDCAVDFRPDDFSYRAVIELFYFSICSNIIPSMPSCNLRFVLEECVLSVAPYDQASNNYPCFKVSFVDGKSLVPVLDIGYIDISLRLNDAETEKLPILDLRCSIHDVHFRTCYDSGSAFAQLIGHIARNANDANKPANSKENSLQSSASSESDLFLSQTQPSEEITNKQQERLNTLMAEAVQEASKEFKRGESPPQLEDELKLFYFPDESNKMNKKDIKIDQSIKSASKISEPLPLIKAEFGDVMEERVAFEEHHNISSTDEDYCIVAEEENCLDNAAKYDFDEIRVTDDPIMIVDNHFCLPSSSNDLLRTPAQFPMPDRRYTLCEMTLTWHLYGGQDFSDSISLTGDPVIPKTPMSDTYRHGVSYSNESNRLQQEKKPKEKLTWKSIGGINRNHEILVEMQFTKVRFSYEIYPQYTTYAARQVLLVNEIEIRDRLQSSAINKFLYNANIKSFTNRSSQHMVIVKALHVRPNPQQSSAQECTLRISLSPLRVHIDQDTLEFLTDFFTSFGKVCESDTSLESGSNDELKQTKSLHKSELPIMSINADEDEENEIPEAVHDLRARRIVSENISLLIDEKENDQRPIKDNIKPATDLSSAPIYFREIVFGPDVSICFDYHGRRVELSKGTIAGLLMGLGQLQCSEIILRKIVYRRGLLGFEKVCNYLCKEWLRDIKRNQLPKILSGVGPTYAFVQLFQGIYDLFWLPIEHYQKDGRIIRGLQLGAQSFSARTILAALEITSRLIQLLQFTAETAFDMVSSGPSIRQTKKNKRGKRKRHNRPRDIREGVANAYQILKEGINDSASNLIETAAAEHDQKGLTGAVGAVMRQVPQLVVCPAVLATQATTNILGGVKSSLVPEAKLEAREKWKDENC